MESDVRSFLAAFEPVDEYDAPWGAGTLRIAWYLHDGPLPPAVLSRVTSIRCIVLRLDPQYPERPEVLVIRTRDGHTHVWPGGRREPGESPRETATREVWEEAGCRVRGLRPIGFTHLYRTEPPPPGHPYPTEFFYALYAAELLTQDETARGLDKDEEDLGFVPIADLSSVELESAARPIVEAALRAVRPAAGGGSYTAGVAQISEQGVAPALIFGRDQKILFIGDSITDCGRRGGADSTGPHVPYGNGYVHLARAFLLARHGEQGLEIVNRGISGNTVRDLDRRWEQDVIAEQPDWLSVKIGINDVWRLIANRRADHVPLDEYEATLRKLLD
ncbi:MAG TPA: NUDIX domain-containing protein, partial [Chloroflexota bacterium]|nr:NUDIX domain-containing protein [Chloroflexota bacterium]